VNLDSASLTSDAVTLAALALLVRAIAGLVAQVGTALTKRAEAARLAEYAQFERAQAARIAEENTGKVLVQSAYRAASDEDEIDRLRGRVAELEAELEAERSKADSAIRALRHELDELAASIDSGTGRASRRTP
jgi:predicted  nucleic acid-binding Zn-ribbon protein